MPSGCALPVWGVVQVRGFGKVGWHQDPREKPMINTYSPFAARNVLFSPFLFVVLALIVC